MQRQWRLRTAAAVSGEASGHAEEHPMARRAPDPTFSPSATSAMRGPPERWAYVATVHASGERRPDAVAVVDVEPRSPTYGQLVGGVEMPYTGDALHCFGWNACSAALCPAAPPAPPERRYLVVPGLRSSRLYVLDTRPEPTQPRLVKIIEPQEVMARANYSRLHTVRSGPDGIYISALGDAAGDGPGGIFLMDPESFEIRGRWEMDRGPQYLAADFGWHLGHEVLVTSEWGTPHMIDEGVQLDILLQSGYGHHLHLWDLRNRRHLRALDVGKDQQMLLALRPAHDPTTAYGFVGVVVSLKDLSGSVWLWHQRGTGWAVRKVIEIPAEPADPSRLPLLLKEFKAVPPLVTAINLSLDDRFLYVSCWGTGELRQYDVSDPFTPRLTGAVRLGGIVRQAPHPGQPAVPLNGGPQMVEISRDGRRVYCTNSLYASWDEQFYPAGVRSWMVKLDADPEGGLHADPTFFVAFAERGSYQIRLEGGDASSDAYGCP